LLSIKTEEEFQKRFVQTPLLRTKRRGLVRNALVVIGNKKPNGGADRLKQFAQEEQDPMLLEHIQWALAQY